MEQKNGILGERVSRRSLFCCLKGFSVCFMGRCDVERGSWLMLVSAALHLPRLGPRAGGLEHWRGGWTSFILTLE